MAYTPQVGDTARVVVVGPVTQYDPATGQTKVGNAQLGAVNFLTADRIVVELEKVLPPESWRDDDVVLSARNLLLQFGGIVALNDVSIDVRKDELLAIIGPNGAGKSSLMNCLSGFYRPKKGDITLGGRSVRQMAVHAGAIARAEPRTGERRDTGVEWDADGIDD